MRRQERGARCCILLTQHASQVWGVKIIRIVVPDGDSAEYCYARCKKIVALRHPGRMLHMWVYKRSQ